MNNFSRIFKYGWFGFVRNLWVSFATVGIMILALSVVSSLLIIGSITDGFVKDLQGKVDVSVYFRQKLEESKIVELQSALGARSDVREVEYISSEKALDLFKERHKDNELLMASLAELSSNPFQASLNIKANETSQFTAIVSFIETSPIKDLIEKINYKQNEKMIERLTSITSSIENFGIFFTFALSFVAVVITFNTIRLVIYNSKDEITVMKLVGASDWFIRGPFVIAGILYGIFSAIFTWLAFSLIVWLLSEKAIIVFPGADILGYWSSSAFGIIALLLGFGISLGAVSSFIAISRYLKV